MPNNETIERIAEKYGFCSRTFQDGSTTTNDVMYDRQFIAALSEMRGISLKEAAEIAQNYECTVLTANEPTPDGMRHAIAGAILGRIGSL